MSNHVKEYSGGAPSWLRNSNEGMSLFERRYSAPSLSGNIVNGLQNLFLTSVASNHNVPLQYYNSPYVNGVNVASGNHNPSRMYNVTSNESATSYNERVLSDTIKGTPNVSVYKVSKTSHLPQYMQSDDNNDTIIALKSGDSGSSTTTEPKMNDSKVYAMFKH